MLLEVHNQGPPIAPDLLPRIFEAFQRGAGGSGDGLGLGLYIVKRLVEAHGGSIEVRSDAAGGTRFSVQWPKHF
ncbi:MAG TPA: sensor histidine kinase [Myxococcales bacterium]